MNIGRRVFAWVDDDDVDDDDCVVVVDDDDVENDKKLFNDAYS